MHPVGFICKIVLLYIRLYSVIFIPTRTNHIQDTRYTDAETCTVSPFVVTFLRFYSHRPVLVMFVLVVVVFMSHTRRVQKKPELLV